LAHWPLFVPRFANRDVRPARAQHSATGRNSESGLAPVRNGRAHPRRRPRRGLRRHGWSRGGQGRAGCRRPPLVSPTSLPAHVLGRYERAPRRRAQPAESPARRRRQPRRTARRIGGRRRRWRQGVGSRRWLPGGLGGRSSLTGSSRASDRVPFEVTSSRSRHGRSCWSGPPPSRIAPDSCGCDATGRVPSTRVSVHDRVEAVRAAPSGCRTPPLP
jgi:hypothetical protein